jgi:hypothetical protein
LCGPKTSTILGRDLEVGIWRLVDPVEAWGRGLRARSERKPCIWWWVAEANGVGALVRYSLLGGVVEVKLSSLPWLTSEETVDFCDRTMAAF